MHRSTIYLVLMYFPGSLQWRDELCEKGEWQKTSTAILFDRELTDRRTMSLGHVQIF